MYSCTDGDRVPQISRGRGRLASESMQTLDLMRYAMTSPSHMGRTITNEYSMGGTSYGSQTTSASDSGYGQLRESSTRPAGGGSLQRPLRVCLLSPSLIR